MTFGEKILYLRKEKSWSQAELAEKLGTHGALIGKYERNESRPLVDTAKKMADAFGVSLDYLADETSLSSSFRDKKILERIAEIERLPNEDKSHIYYLIDGLVRDAKTRLAYQ